jgi:SAM-dependent methyltransferase
MSDNSRSAAISALAGTPEVELPGRLRLLTGPEQPALLDLRDEPGIKRYLESFDMFADAPAEGRNYIAHGVRRFVITTEMTPPAKRAGQRLLEIGASPYYITLLLHRLRGYEVYMTNFFSEAYPKIGQQIVSSHRFGESYQCNFVSVNVERERLPYPDHSFDVVLFCEVIEHLTQDPTFALCELHRVLKPNGYLLLTTPNVYRIQNVLGILSGRSNLFHPYSGHGVYGRHQREYGMGEAQDLIAGCGYSISESRVEDYEPGGRILQHALKRAMPSRRDNLFILARAMARRRFYYPPWLYIATQGIQHVVDSDVTMGINDVGHLGWGWWNQDMLPGFVARWTTEHARASLALPAAPYSHLVIEANGLGEKLAPTTATVAIEDLRHEFLLDKDEWRELKIPLPDDLTGDTVAFSIYVHPLRSPQALGVSSDSRELGIMVRRLRIY